MGQQQSLQKDLWCGRGSSCAMAQAVPRGTEEATSPERCPTCPGLHSAVSHPAGYAAPYLTVFSENSIDVFDVRKAEWVQTVPLKKVRGCQSPGAGWGRVG